jgi:hypothetical protein
LDLCTRAFPDLDRRRYCHIPIGRRTPIPDIEKKYFLKINSPELPLTGYINQKTARPIHFLNVACPVDAYYRLFPRAVHGLAKRASTDRSVPHQSCVLARRSSLIASCPRLFGSDMTYLTVGLGLSSRGRMAKPLNHVRMPPESKSTVINRRWRGQVFHCPETKRQGPPVMDGPWFLFPQNDYAARFRRQ